MASNNLYGALGNFRKGKDAGETLEKIEKYVKRAKLVYGAEGITEDLKKISLFQIWGGDELMTLVDHVGKLEEGQTFDELVTSIRNGLKATMNDVFPMYKLFHQMPQGQKSLLIGSLKSASKQRDAH